MNNNNQGIMGLVLSVSKTANFLGYSDQIGLNEYINKINIMDSLK